MDWGAADRKELLPVGPDGEGTVSQARGIAGNCQAVPARDGCRKAIN